MNIREAKSEIIHTIKAYTAKNPWGGYGIPSIHQRPLLLIGPPGIGKTAVMAQAAAECGVCFVAYTMTHHTRQSAMGLPFIQHRQFGGQEYAVTEYTMSEIIASVYRAMEESGRSQGLLFLDEINCVSETLAPAMLQFLQTKTFGSHHLPEGWILAAAGNPQEYNKSAREFDIATLDRLKYITVEADYEVWRSYALTEGVHGAVLSFLDTHPEQFYVLEQTYTVQTFATARGWEDLSFLLIQYESLGLPVNADVIRQYLHSESLAQEFAGYYLWYTARQKNFPVREMLLGDASAFSVCQDLLTGSSFDEQLHLVHLLLSCIGSSLAQYERQQTQTRLYCDLSGRLDRTLRQAALKPSGQTDTFGDLDAFFNNEREVLRVRREHCLSSEEELAQMHQVLYTLQQQCCRHLAGAGASVYKTLPDFLRDEAAAQKENPDALALQTLTMLRNAALLFHQPEQGAASTLLISSLRNNSRLTLFLKKHPCPILEDKFSQMDIENREARLRKKLADL